MNLAEHRQKKLTAMVKSVDITARTINSQFNDISEKMDLFTRYLAMEKFLKVDLFKWIPFDDDDIISCFFDNEDKQADARRAALTNELVHGITRDNSWGLKVG